MEIKKENGKVITTMTFSECFFGYKNDFLSKSIIDRFNEIISYPYRPERLSPEDHIVYVNKMVSDSLIS